jgi:predicted amidophosphoribosyltransferase
MLVDFSKTRPHRTLGLRNLVQLRDASLIDWLRDQEKRWTCFSCGKKLHWYAEKCSRCGAKFLTATQEASL